VSPSLPSHYLDHSTTEATSVVDLLYSVSRVRLAVNLMTVIIVIIKYVVTYDSCVVFLCARA